MDKGQSLPSKIQVKIFKGTSGVYIAELPEFDISTEADSPSDIDTLINDLIYVYFDVPADLRKIIRYMPEEPAKEMNLRSQLIFQKFISSDAQRIFK